jgi:hypothetical protein
MARLHNVATSSPIGRLFRFGLFQGLRSVEIDPEDFRDYLARKHRLHVSDFSRMHLVPVERLDYIAQQLIKDARCDSLLAEGAGFGLGGMITLIPDAGLLTIITLRLIQRLTLLYGFEAQGDDERRRTFGSRRPLPTGIDFGKDLAEKQLVEKLAAGESPNASASNSGEGSRGKVDQQADSLWTSSVDRRRV